MADIYIPSSCEASMTRPLAPVFSIFCTADSGPTLTEAQDLCLEQSETFLFLLPDRRHERLSFEDHSSPGNSEALNMSECITRSPQVHDSMRIPYQDTKNTRFVSDKI